MRSILFLNYYCFGPHSAVECVELADRLAELVAPYPELKIVLTTSWPSSFSSRRADASLPQVLLSRVVGSIPANGEDSGEVDMSEFEQIRRYLNRHGIHSWVALGYGSSDRPEDIHENVVSVDELESPSGWKEFAERLGRMHSKEFQRVTAQHHWTQDMLAANRYLEAAAQALADAMAGIDDATRLQAARAAVLACGMALASAQQFRTTDESLLVAFLGNGLGWDRYKRAATLKLLGCQRVDSQEASRIAPGAIDEVLRLAEAILQEARRWLTERCESYER